MVFDRPRAHQVVFEEIDWEDPQRKEYYRRNREFISRVAPLEDCLTEDPIQVMYTGTVREMREAEALLAAARRRLRLHAGSHVLRQPRFRHGGRGPRGRCSKGATLAEWAAHRGIAREEVMAIGDNLNDREMLEFAGLPIVMGNCVAELKSLGWRDERARTTRAA